MLDVSPPASVDPQLLWLCETLRTLRRGSRLTQAELARRSGISQPELSRIERAQTTPSYLRLCTLLTALGARLLLEADDSVIALTPDKGPPTKQPDGSSPKIDRM
jgi:transcriptional regulator with XRE-family HTH domain